MIDALTYGRARWPTQGRYSVAQTARDAVAQAGSMGVAITMARLGLAPIMVASFMTSPAITTMALAIFVLADVQDGVVARRRGSDGPARRALDSAVDRLTIDTCLIAACLGGALSPILLGAFLLRDLYCARICAHMMGIAKVAIKADWLYRALNLSVAAWATLAPFISSDVRMSLFVAVLAGGCIVAFDLSRSVRSVLADPALRGVVVNAGYLRRARQI